MLGLLTTIDFIGIILWLLGFKKSGITLTVISSIGCILRYVDITKNEEES